MRLLSRYLLRQLVAPFLFALAALTSLMLLSQIAKKFGALVGKGLPWAVIAEVFALSLPFIVAMTLPMAVLLAVLYAFSHLAADNEITAMRASGISVYQVLTPVLAWGVLHVGAQLRLRGPGPAPDQCPAPGPPDRHRPEETHLRAAGAGHQRGAARPSTSCGPAGSTRPPAGSRTSRSTMWAARPAGGSSMPTAAGWPTPRARPTSASACSTAASTSTGRATR